MKKQESYILMEKLEPRENKVDVSLCLCFFLGLGVDLGDVEIEYDSSWDDDLDHWGTHV